MPNYFDQFDEQAPAQGGNYFDQFDVVSEGGPQSIGRKQDGLERSKMPDWAGALMRVNPLTPGPVIDFVDRIGKEGERKDAAGRAAIAPTMMRHGYDLGLSDERAGIRAQANRLPVVGEVINRAADIIPGGNIAQGLAGIVAEKNGGTDTYDAAQAETQAKIDQARTDFPGTSMLYELAGGAGYGGGAGKPTTSLIAQGLEGAKVGTGLGAAYGAADRNENRVGGAIEGGFWGALFGGVLGSGAQAVGNKASTGKLLGAKTGDIILDTAAKGLDIPDSSVRALRQVISNGGYSGDDISRGMVNIVDRLKTAADTGDRAGLFALELQKEFPAASQQVQDVFQQLMTAPPRQGQTGRILTQALDDQYGSQGQYLEGVTQKNLGTRTVAEEQAAIAADRAEIGNIRDRVIKFAATDARGKGIRNQMTKWVDDFANDREVMGAMRAAARELGFGGNTEVADAIASNPALLLQKFGEVSGATIRSPRGASPVLQQARQESEKLFDDISRYTRQEGNYAFAPKDTGEVGPYKRQQARFRENYSQEQAIADARGKFAQVRDPVKADQFIAEFNALPDGEKQLWKTVIRQDIEKMLRGGNIDQDGAYLTNLKKVGVNDVLERMFGEKGKRITRAIGQLVDEQKGLTGLDPRKGLQERVVRGPAADRARNLYTTNPIARLGDRLPAVSQMADIGLMASGQLPYITLAKQGSKFFRPRPATREGLARLFAMRPDTLPPGPARAAPVAPTGAAGPASGQLPRLTAPEAPQPSRAVVTAEQRMFAAQQKAETARQRTEQAKAAATSEAEVRKLEIEAAQADAEAQIAERELATAQKITEAARKAVQKATRKQVGEAKKAEPKRLKAIAAETDLSMARRNLEQSNAAAAEIERAGTQRAQAERMTREGKSRLRSAEEKASWEEAQAMAEAGADPNWRETEAGRNYVYTIQNRTGRTYIRTDSGNLVQLTPDAPKMNPRQAQAEFDRLWTEVDPEQWPAWMKTQMFDIAGARSGAERSRLMAFWKSRHETRQVRARGEQIKADRAEAEARQAGRSRNRRRLAAVGLAAGATAAGGYTAAHLEGKRPRRRRAAPTTIRVRKAKRLSDLPAPPSRKPDR